MPCKTRPITICIAQSFLSVTYFPMSFHLTYLPVKGPHPQDDREIIFCLMGALP